MSETVPTPHLTDLEITKLLTSFVDANTSLPALEDGATPTITYEPQSSHRRALRFMIDCDNPKANEEIAHQLDLLKIPYGLDEPYGRINIFAQDLLFANDGHARLKALQDFVMQSAKDFPPEAYHITFESLPASNTYTEHPGGQKPQGPNAIKIKLAKELGETWAVTDSKPMNKDVFIVNDEANPFRAAVNYGEEGHIALNALLDEQYADAMRIYMESDRVRDLLKTYKASATVSEPYPDHVEFARRESADAELKHNIGKAIRIETPEAKPVKKEISLRIQNPSGFFLALEEARGEYATTREAIYANTQMIDQALTSAGFGRA